MTRKIGLLSLLVVATLFIRDVSATPTEILPSSSHYQGRSYFDTWTAGGDHLTGRIDFAVYDTVTNPDEFVGAGFVNPGGNRYVYAYQIFCDDSTTALDYFAILNLDESGIGIDTTGDIDSQDDLTVDSVEPDLEYFNSSTTYGGMAVWEFDGGYLVAGEHSWFLVLSSDQDWIVGGYTFDRIVADGVPISPGNPEPGTLALLGFGGVMEFMRRRKLLRRHKTC
jgi:hypothetical protein